ncbi:MAG: peptide MFS transporter [Bacteroidales bacterium]|nr:peptide MFS transporter [Bacteroidales bacterium]
MSTFSKHPKELWILGLTEMAERFAFYLMLGILMLYMIAPENAKFPGFGFSNANASDIMGTYLALLYLTPFIGGMLADRVLGYRRSITIGGILMGLGYFGLAAHNQTFFYLSLLLIILGNGFFKPNISTLVGRLYEKAQYKHLKDDGFNIFYLFINIGAFLCNFFAAYLRINYGWGWAFMAAGAGMFAGLAFLWSSQLFTTELKRVDTIQRDVNGNGELIRLLGKMLLPAFALAAVGWFVPPLLIGGPFLGTSSTDAFLFFCFPVVFFFYSLYKNAPLFKEQRQIRALMTIFVVVIIFWAVFHQNASALTLWAEDFTNRTVPALLTGITDALSLSQSDGSQKFFSAELFQSVNPGFVVFLTPLIVGFFRILRKRDKEPSTPVKIAWGLGITAISALVMMVAVIVSNNGATKASPLWLISTYGIITVGELFLSPMGLSLVSKLSPARYTSLLMGGWFLSTSIGNKLSGVMASMWDGYTNKAFYFLTNAGLAMVAVIILIILLPGLKKVVSEDQNG